MTAPLFASIAGVAFERFRSALDRLGNAPPQVLLLEGGREEDRLSMTGYWAARCNCGNLRENAAPCLSCSVCLRIAAGEHSDVLVYDGRISNKEDEENPGVVRALTVDHARDLKRRLGEAPNGDGRRVVALMGIKQSRTDAANALLKVLEEPTPNTVFVLLAPQREQLLPTLVSRSFCLTLPFPDECVSDEESTEWEAGLAGFLRDGRDFFERVSAKNAISADMAARLLLACQKACGVLLAKDGKHAERPLVAALESFSARDLAVCCRWFAEAQEALNSSVTPVRVLQALAARMYVLRADSRAAGMARREETVF